ncbi:MAG TPA: type I restriction-modification system subunit M N-terminal domain-containing protein, partial [Phycisphaerae bacterium]|nr:type I restriction-modification system subunit M N-terminal domain-containing protein [Phycisphaerae bacterium]
MNDVVQKLWGFCNTLRHDGVGYTEYVEQLTYLLFIKMADERGIKLEETPVRQGGRRRTIDGSWGALRDVPTAESLDRYTN